MQVTRRTFHFWLATAGVNSVPEKMRTRFKETPFLASAGDINDEEGRSTSKSDVAERDTSTSMKADDSLPMSTRLN